MSEPVRSGGGINGEILYRDKFGNLMTNIPLSMFRSVGPSNMRGGVVLHLGKKRIRRLVASYTEAKDSRPFFLVNSQGLVEIAVREGSAAALLGAKPGDPVKLRWER
jgi:S-adenosylmethionine hydrolase